MDECVYADFQCFSPSYSARSSAERIAKAQKPPRSKSSATYETYRGCETAFSNDWQAQAGNKASAVGIQQQSVFADVRNNYLSSAQRRKANDPAATVANIPCRADTQTSLTDVARYSEPKGSLTYVDTLCIHYSEPHRGGHFNQLCFSQTAGRFVYSTRHYPRIVFHPNNNAKNLLSSGKPNIAGSNSGERC